MENLETRAKVTETSKTTRLHLHRIDDTPFCKHNSEKVESKKTSWDPRRLLLHSYVLQLNRLKPLRKQSRTTVEITTIMLAITRSRHCL